MTHNIVDSIFKANPEQVIEIIASEPQIDTTFKKVLVKQMRSKKGIFFQAIFQSNYESTTQMIPVDTLLKTFEEIEKTYAQILIRLPSIEYALSKSKDGKRRIKERALPTNYTVHTEHNRKKHYTIEQDSCRSWLTALDLAHESGTIKHNQQHKFKQIHRFIELIEKNLINLSQKEPLHILDIGCGKAYLTFGLMQYMLDNHIPGSIIGIDRKLEVIKKCNTIAEQAGFADTLTFICTTAEELDHSQPINAVVSLHACNTATDYALRTALQRDAKFIAVAPCCHHELYDQIQPVFSPILFKHAIIKERVSALYTDALRAELLSCFGYETDVIEFVDSSHTPKNLLIRAVKKTQIDKSRLSALIEELRNYTIDQTLIRFVQNIC